MITKKGRELSWKLNPSMGTTRHIEETCSRICRQAKTYDNYLVEKCNGDMREQFSNMTEWVEVIEERTEKCVNRIKQLCIDLPTIDGQYTYPVFDYEPGSPIKLILSDGRYDDFEKTGICIPM